MRCILQLIMGKKQQQNNNSTQANKGHKTLRDKLRKKREELKKHKKEKSQKHKQYNPQEKKKQFFAKASEPSKKRDDGIKETKLKRYIEKFVDIYEDDVEDFYDLFGTLDQGGTIDITDVADPKMQKCLKKMFKYMPLIKKKLQYQKKQGAVKLKPIIKQFVTKSIERYMEEGTDGQEGNRSDKQSSQEDNNMEEQKQQKTHKKNKKSKQKSDKQKQIDPETEKKIKNQIQNQTIKEYQKLQLYPEKIIQHQAQSEIVGPFIPTEQRQYLAKMFEQQLQKGIPNDEDVRKQQMQQQDNNEFDRIFGMASARELKGKSNVAKPSIDDVPEQLLAAGSARIGQKQQIDPNEIEEYNKNFRPRKLIEQHQEMKRLGKYAETDANGKKKRVPFDRQRDVVNGRSREFMNNGVFFDFKERMTKPQGSNNFL